MGKQNKGRSGGEMLSILIIMQAKYTIFQINSVLQV